MAEEPGKVQVKRGAQYQGCHPGPAFMPWEVGCMSVSSCEAAFTRGCQPCLPQPCSGTWHADAVDIHLLQKVQGLQDPCHLGGGHVFPLPPAASKVGF